MELFPGSLSLGSSQTLGLGCFLCLDDLQTGELFPVLFIQRVRDELHCTLQIGDHHILQGVGPALGLDDGAVLAGVDAAAAGDALVVVDVGPVVHDGDGVLGAGVDAAGGQTAAAGVTHGDLGDGALVTGDGQHLHHAGVGLVAAHGQLHPAVDDGPLLIDAAAQAGPGAGDDLFGDIQNSGLGAVFPSQAGDLRQDRSFQLLDLCLKITHTSSFLQLFPVLSMVS